MSVKLEHISVIVVKGYVQIREEAILAPVKQDMLCSLIKDLVEVKG